MGAGQSMEIGSDVDITEGATVKSSQKVQDMSRGGADAKDERSPPMMSSPTGANAANGRVNGAVRSPLKRSRMRDEADHEHDDMPPSPRRPRTGEYCRSGRSSSPPGNIHDLPRGRGDYYRPGMGRRRTSPSRSLDRRDQRYVRHDADPTDRFRDSSPRRPPPEDSRRAPKPYLSSPTSRRAPLIESPVSPEIPAAHTSNRATFTNLSWKNPALERKQCPIPLRKLSGGTTEHNGLKDVPTGPRRMADPRHMPDQFLPADVGLIVKQQPHIYIRGRDLPPKKATVPHLRKALKPYIAYDSEIALDQSGYYLRFDNSDQGGKMLEECYESHNSKMLFGEYTLYMVRFPHGQLPASEAEERSVAALRNDASASLAASITTAEAQQDHVSATATNGAGPLDLRSSVGPLRRDNASSSSPFLGDDTSSCFSGRTDNCHICKNAPVSAKDSLTQCSTCPRRYHRRCHLKPPIPGDLDRAHTWQCRRCVKKQILPLSTVSTYAEPLTTHHSPPPSKQLNAGERSAHVQIAGVSVGNVIDGTFCPANSIAPAQSKEIRSEEHPDITSLPQADGAASPEITTSDEIQLEADKLVEQAFAPLPQETLPTVSRPSKQMFFRKKLPARVVDEVSEASSAQPSGASAPSAEADSSTVTANHNSSPPKRKSHKWTGGGADKAVIDQWNAMNTATKTFGVNKPATSSSIPEQPVATTPVSFGLGTDNEAQTSGAAQTSAADQMTAAAAQGTVDTVMKDITPPGEGTPATGHVSSVSGNTGPLYPADTAEPHEATSAKVCPESGPSRGQGEQPMEGPAPKPKPTLARQSGKRVANCEDCGKTVAHDPSASRILCSRCKKAAAAASAQPSKDLTVSIPPKNNDHVEAAAVRDAITTLVQEAKDLGADAGESTEDPLAGQDQIAKASNAQGKDSTEAVENAFKYGDKDHQEAHGTSSQQDEASGTQQSITSHNGRPTGACQDCRRRHVKCVHNANGDSHSRPSWACEDLRRRRVKCFHNAAGSMQRATEVEDVADDTHKGKASDLDFWNPAESTESDLSDPADSDLGDFELSPARQPVARGPESIVASTKRSARTNFTTAAMHQYDLGNSFERPKGTYEKLIGMAMLALRDAGTQITNNEMVKWIAENIPGYNLGEGQTGNGWESAVKATVTMGSEQKVKGNKKAYWKRGRETGGRNGEVEWLLLPGAERVLLRWDHVLKEPVSPDGVRSSSSRDGTANDVTGDTGQRRTPKQPMATSLRADSTRTTVSQAGTPSKGPNHRQLLKPSTSVQATVEDVDTTDEDDGGEVNEHAVAQDVVHNSQEKQPSPAMSASSDDKPLMHRRSKQTSSRATPAVDSAHATDSMDVDTPPQRAKPDVITAGAVEASLLSASQPRPDRPQLDRDGLGLAALIKKESENVDYSALSLFDEWPEYDPAKAFDRDAKIAEIKKRPTRKQRFGQPSRDPWSEWKPKRLLQHQQEQEAETEGRSSRAARKTGFGLHLWSVENVVQEVDSFEELFGLPEKPLAIIDGPDRQLMFRDGTRNEEGVLPRARVKYEVGYA